MKRLFLVNNPMVLIILLLITLLFCLSCDVNRTEENENIIDIKQRIYFGECIGYCNTQIIIDSAMIEFIKKGWTGKEELPEKDTIFKINSIDWLKIRTSVSFDKFLKLDSAYIEEYYVDDGLVTIEIRTNKRYKIVRHDYSLHLPVLDSLYSIIRSIREDL